MNILAIGAHPDDIEYGCGGTLIKYFEGGAKIYLSIISLPRVAEQAEIRKKEANEAASLLGSKWLAWAGFIDTEIFSSRILINHLEEGIRTVDADMVLFHFQNDTHQDHVQVAMAALAATRYHRNVLMYESLTSIDFNPRVFVDIKDQFSKKMEAIGQHSSQMDKTRVGDANYQYLASSTAVARGIQARCDYAEAFVPVRVFVGEHFGKTQAE